MSFKQFVEQNELNEAKSSVEVVVNLYDLKKIMDRLADIYTKSTQANDVTPELKKLVNEMFVWYALQRKKAQKQQPQPTQFRMPEPSMN